MSGSMHPASDVDAGRMWPVVRKAHLFDTVARYEEFRAEGPWRIQVSGNGEAAVLERWRDHLDVLAIKGMWCTADRMPVLIDELTDVAAGQGFGRLLSPLVSADVAPAYEAGGMRPFEHIVVLRRDRIAGDVASMPAPAGTCIRPATPLDLDALLDLDATCFDEFWRYDVAKVQRHFAEDRLMVAEKDGVVIGYTLATVIRESATLGRLAVSPACRGQGIGAALLSDALGYFARAGADSVTLCTQEGNSVSRRLYFSAGMRELPARLLFLIRDVGGE